MTERRPNEQQSQLVRKILSESCFYRILGVSKDASEVECKKAYKRVFFIDCRLF